MRKIKVLHILWSGRKGGAEKIATMLAEKVNNNFESSVLFLSDYQFWGNYLSKKGIKIYKLSIKSSWSIFSIIKFIIFLLKNKHNIYHDHISAPFVKFILKMFKRTVVFTTHNCPRTLEKMNVIKRKLITGFADFYITPSNYMKEYYRKKYLKNSLLIYHGIEIDRYKKNTVRDNKNIFIGTLTHLEKNKNNELIIEIVKDLLKKSDNFKVLIAGDGNLRDRILKLVKTFKLENYIELIGTVEDEVEFLNKIDIYINTSYDESFSIAVVEAMIMGLPVVCSNIPAHREIIDNEINGFLRNAKSEEMADVIRRLIVDKNLRENIGARAKKTVNEKYNINRMVEEYKKLYLNIAKRSSL